MRYLHTFLFFISSLIKNKKTFWIFFSSRTDILARKCSQPPLANQLLHFLPNLFLCFDREMFKVEVLANKTSKSFKTIKLGSNLIYAKMSVCDERFQHPHKAMRFELATQKCWRRCDFQDHLLFNQRYLTNANRYFHEFGLI